jgi:hypothetical protein
VREKPIALSVPNRSGFILTKGRPWTAPIWVSELGTCTGRHACITDGAGGSQGQWFDALRAMAPARQGPR